MHKICEDDIELHSFEEVSTETAISLRPLVSEDPNLRLVADEMEGKAHFVTYTYIHTHMFYKHVNLSFSVPSLLLRDH